MRCEICEHGFFSKEGRFPVGKPVTHHLIPKQKFRGKSSDAQTIIICSRCHKQMHKLYDNYTLKRRLSAITELKNDPKMQKFVRWVRKEG